ncbi:DUF6985 domain-containing protein [Donghicola mangrovi]|uniref:DUF6985 domain-containing protein n=1 Tax=Donghicola mangrovi TaxID=2729614 RepID=A0A850PZ58_9RHOB|nr:hypothetical protein [Donghicola mangrovi]NVO22557.1 hypothetical protein [Donghicola mangrovi]
MNNALLPVDMSGDEMFTLKAANALKRLRLDCPETAERIRKLLWLAACESHAQNLEMFPTLQDQVDSEARFAGKRPGQIAPTGPKDIMAAVTFTGVHVINSTSADGQARLLIGVMGECSWDAEYGVAVLFDDAGRLVSAGGA